MSAALRDALLDVLQRCDDQLTDRLAGGVRGFTTPLIQEVRALRRDLAALPAEPAHSKSEYKRRVAMGDPRVQPPTEPAQGAAARNLGASPCACGSWIPAQCTCPAARGAAAPAAIVRITKPNRSLTHMEWVKHLDLPEGEHSLYLAAPTREAGSVPAERTPSAAVRRVFASLPPTNTQSTASEASGEVAK